MPTFDPFAHPSIEAATAWVFSSEGPLVARGYEIRESQKTLALAVARSIDSGAPPSWVLGEAPCGTGKGMAYLIPGIIAALREERDWARGKRREGEGSFRKLVVSTVNIALQGQLVNKDIPGVASILGVEVRAALYKGRNNFLCKEKVQEESAGLIVDQGVRRLVEWTRDPSCSGDREDLTWDPGWAWGKLSVGSDGCHGKKCPYFRADGENLCYAERARVGVERAHVVIVNHYLLAISPRAIPSVCLAVDEAHDLEDCIRKATSAQIGDRTFIGLGGRVRTILGPDRAQDFVTPLEDLFGTLGVYLDGKGNGGDWATVVPLSEGWHGGTFDTQKLLVIREIVKEIGVLSRQATDENESGKLEKFAEVLDTLYLRAVSLADGKPHPEMTGGDPSPWAIWAESTQERGKRGVERRLTANMAPADISARIQSLQRAYPRAVLTSATLAVDGGFTYVRNTLGMAEKGKPAEFAEVEVPIAGSQTGETTRLRRQIKSAGPVEELILPSPYNLEKMSALIIPADVVNPKDQRWQEWAVQKVIETVKLAQGRTLVLASSRRMMDRYGFALEQRTPYPVRVQGSAGRNDLIRWFTETTDGVLVATRSFFQGLDVRGESLSCVVIDRVPFDRPDDPLENAVADLIAQRVGGNPFSVRSLPKTCMVLAQAAGRLIRGQGDRGVIVCLDSKVVSGSMSTPLRRSFSGIPLSRDLGDVARVIDGGSISTTPLRAGSIRRGHHAVP